MMVSVAVEMEAKNEKTKAPLNITIFHHRADVNTVKLKVFNHTEGIM